MKTKLLRKLRKDYRIIQYPNGLWAHQFMFGNEVWYELQYITFSDCLSSVHYSIKKDLVTYYPKRKKSPYIKIIKF